MTMYAAGGVDGGAIRLYEADDGSLLATFVDEAAFKRVTLASVDDFNKMQQFVDEPLMITLRELNATMIEALTEQITDPEKEQTT